jgi:hypothetical protein
MQEVQLGDLDEEMTDEFMVAMDRVLNVLYRIEKKRKGREGKLEKIESLKHGHPCNGDCSPCNEDCRGVTPLPRRCGSGGSIRLRVSAAKDRDERPSPSW